jgi:hypothetical protein
MDYIYAMKRLLIILSIVFLTTCNSKNNKPEESSPQSQALPEIQVENPEESWGGDIAMNIYRIEKISPELTKYTVLSSYQNTAVGFILLFKRPVSKGGFIHDGITFKTLGGDTSNNFLKAIAEIYKVRAPKAVFADSVIVTYYDLAGSVNTNDPNNWVAAQTKLFFSTGEDNPELFLNIDERTKKISFPEKDSSYRTGIITALTRKEK